MYINNIILKIYFNMANHCSDKECKMLEQVSLKPTDDIVDMFMDNEDASMIFWDTVEQSGLTDTLVKDNRANQYVALDELKRKWPNELSFILSSEKVAFYDAFLIDDVTPFLEILDDKFKNITFKKIALNEDDEESEQDLEDVQFEAKKQIISYMHSNHIWSLMYVPNLLKTIKLRDFGYIYELLCEKSLHTRQLFVEVVNNLFLYDKPLDQTKDLEDRFELGERLGIVFNSVKMEWMNVIVLLKKFDLSSAIAYPGPMIVKYLYSISSEEQQIKLATDITYVKEKYIETIKNTKEYKAFIKKYYLKDCDH